MVDRIDKALKIKKHVQQMKDEKHRAEGAYKTVMDLIKKNTNCNSLGEAKKALERLQKEVNLSKSKLTKETAKLEQEIREAYEH